MRNAIKSKLIVLFTVLMAGCSNLGIYEVTQVTSNPSQLTIAKDSKTRKSVLPILEKWAFENGYDVKTIDNYVMAERNEYTLTYRVWWGWDVASYMKKAEMKVLKDGVAVGSLKFDATEYGAFGKFGDAEDRLNILMDVLFNKITVAEGNKRAGDA
ncbi:hypothetical protein G3R49_19020 [Shewanella sp. WXL01]|uniref:Lipoprotein n=1 Tax=Shewanella maritima TaxID=2520507 RepID=A0A411PL98_9GAMM|nr:MULTISPECIES: Sbal_3080 family lipoprotein [Shewanella]NKF52653.1 hypothetical protein [Shewanella sp. WXL01]QBF84299.1 hypothetical protein EXU30_17680 [Shewanella maritima]